MQLSKEKVKEKTKKKPETKAAQKGPRWSTEFLQYCRFIWRRTNEDSCAQMASALTLTSVLSLVPLLTVIFTFLGVLPAFRVEAQELVNHALIHFLPTSAEVVQSYLLQFTKQAAGLSGIGGLFLFITALILIANIEQALNTIWRVPVARKGFAALVLYWAILTLTPLLMVASIAITSYFSGFHVIFPLTWLEGEWAKILPFLSTIVVFTLLYITVPNCKVPKLHALIGATFAAVLFEVGRFGFRMYIAYFPHYQLLYGALATLPIFTFWIYSSWLFILLGAEIAHGLRYYDRKFIEEIPSFLVVYRWLSFLWKAQHQGKGLTLTQLLDKQPLSSRHEAELMIDNLVDKKWIRQTTQGDYVLARDLHEVTIVDLYRSVGYALPNMDEMKLHMHSRAATTEADKALLQALKTTEDTLSGIKVSSLANAFPVE